MLVNYLQSKCKINLCFVLELQRGAAVVEGTDEINEGFWKYSNSQENLPFTIWAPNEPNNGDGDEDCMGIHVHFEGLVDIKCNRWVDVALCEVDIC